MKTKADINKIKLSTQLHHCSKLLVHEIPAKSLENVTGVRKNMAKKYNFEFLRKINVRKIEK